MLLAMGLSGCASREDILPLEVMIPLVLEMHLAEASIEHTQKDRQSALDIQRTLEDSIFRRYGVSDSLYVRSLHYYAVHPDAFQTLYAAVLDSLDARLKQTNVAN